MDAPISRPAERRTLWIMLGLVAAAGLATRLAAARGGLWLDEAWSAWFAHEVRTPGGVLLHINHDNNHLLNTLWLQSVGWGAPPLLARALSIAAGTASIVAAGLILAPRGLVAAAVAAALFAFSPLLVTYGAEARGYAPMLLALLVTILIVARSLASQHLPAGRAGLTLAAILGTLAHLTMVFGIAAASGWAALALARRHRLGQAAAATLRLMGGPIVGSIAVLAWVFGAAALSPSGFRVGNYTPFSFRAWASGLEQMVSYALGLGMERGPLLLPPIFGIAALALLRMKSLRPRAGFYLLALFALPLGVAALRLGNSEFPRYYLVAAAALLLLFAELLAEGLAYGGWRRGAASLALAGFAVGSGLMDARIVSDRRADPAEAVPLIAARAPKGAAVWAEAERDAPVLAAAAASARYPLRVTEAPCPPAPFLFRDWERPEEPAAPALVCGVAYRPIAERARNGLSGMGWRLYQRAGPAPPRP